MSDRVHPVARLSDEELLAQTRWMSTGMDAQVQENFLRKNMNRFRTSLLRIPPARSETDRLLDLGCYAVMIPWYVDVLGYRDITAVAYEPRSFFLNEHTKKTGGVTDFCLTVKYLNVEQDAWPFKDESFDRVLCFELLEHMATDPMHLMEEMNRVMRPEAELVLTTPNSASWSSLAAVVLGEQPYTFSPFYGVDGLVNRHNREYVPREIGRLIHASGMDVIELITFENSGRRASVRSIISRLAGVTGILTGRCPASHRGNKILVLARKTGPVRERWPKWLYYDPKLMADKLREAGPKGRRRLEEWK